MKDLNLSKKVEDDMDSICKLSKLLFFYNI